MLEYDASRPRPNQAQLQKQAVLTPVPQPPSPQPSSSQPSSPQPPSAQPPVTPQPATPAPADIPVESRVEVRPGLNATTPVRPVGSAQPQGAGQVQSQGQSQSIELGRLLEDLNTRMLSPDRGSAASMQSMYQLSLPIVAALRASLKASAPPAQAPGTSPAPATTPTPATTQAKPKAPKETQNLDQLRRFSGFTKQLSLEAFAAALGQPASPALTGLHRQLGRQILSWQDLEQALKQAEIPTEGLGNLADAQARWLTKGQASDSVLLIMSSPRDQEQLNLGLEQAHLKDQIGRKRLFSLPNPDPIEIKAMLRTGAFSQLWLSGHGTPGHVVLSDAKGHTRGIRHEDFVALLPDSPKLKGVVTNLCYGGLGGDRSLVNLLEASGVAATGYEAPVEDAIAIGLAKVIGERVQAGATITEAVEASFEQVYPRHQAFLETGDTLADLPRYQVSAKAKAQSDFIGEGIAKVVELSFTRESQAGAERLELCLREYPGLVKAFALVTAITKGDTTQVRDLQIDHPELILVKQEIDSRQAAGSKNGLLYEAVRAYVSLQHLDGKPFLQSARPEASQ